jgi:hypothetical protein
MPRHSQVPETAQPNAAFGVGAPNAHTNGGVTKSRPAEGTFANPTGCRRRATYPVNSGDRHAPTPPDETGDL